MSGNTFRRFLMLFLVQAAIGAVVLFFIHAHLLRTKLEMTKSSDEQFLTNQVERISERFDNIVSELMFLSTYYDLIRFLDDGAPDQYQRLVDYLLSFSLRKEVYDQVRFIDSGGSEVIRVNYNGGDPAVVPKEELVDKSDRFYFTDSITLGYGEVYISPLELHLEQGEIELPYKPTLYFATPIFDSSGNKRGILILNYLAKDMLDAFREAIFHTCCSPLLLDPEGNWLVADKPEKEWGFMLGRDQTFQKEYPASWKRISSEGSGQFRNSEGIFTFRTIYPKAKGWVSRTITHRTTPQSDRTRDSDEYYWKAVTLFTPDEISGIGSSILNRLFAITSAILAIMAFGSGALAFLWSRRLEAEDALKSSESRFRELTGLLPEIVFETDEAANITYLNRIAAELTGYEQEDIENGLNLLDLVEEDGREDAARELEMLLVGKRPSGFEFTMLRKDNRRIPVIIRASRILDSRGRSLGTRGVIINISHIKLAEEELRRSLAEKEVLLMEVHHRVKNNLAIVSAFLNLQASGTDDPYVQGLLTESQQRIHAMALVHEKLYQHRDLATIDFEEYARDLSAFLLRIHSSEDVYVRVSMDIEDIQLSLDSMICCGLIMTELVTNAQKYAFRDTEDPEIRIGLARSDGGLVTFTVKDNGCGLPEGLELGKTRSLGLRIVQSMVMQLNGRLDFSGKGGAEFRVTFDPSLYSEQ